MLNDMFTEIFLAVITSATEIGNTRPSAPRPETVAKIHEVGFYSLTSSTWDTPATYESAPSPSFAEQADAILRDSYSNQTSQNAVFEHPCMPLTKIIAAGTFYYALEPYWDLSSRLSQRITRDEQASQDVGHYDDRFVWNEYIIRSLMDFRERLDPQERSDLDRCQFIVSFPFLSLFRLLKLSGSRHTRSCRDPHTTAACTSNQRKAHDCNDFADLPPELEASWYSFQHQGRG